MDNILYRQKYIKNKMQHACSNGFPYDRLVWLYSIDGSQMEIYSCDFLEDKYIAIYPYFSEMNIPRTDKDLDNCLKNFPLQKASTMDMIDTYLDVEIKQIIVNKLKENSTLSLIDIKLLYKCFKKNIAKQYKKLVQANIILRGEKTTRKMNAEEKRRKLIKIRDIINEVDNNICQPFI